MGQKKWTTKAAEIRKGEQGKAGQEVITAGQNGEECWKGQSRAGQGWWYGGARGKRAEGEIMSVTNELWHSGEHSRSCGHRVWFSLHRGCFSVVWSM